VTLFQERYDKLQCSEVANYDLSGIKLVIFRILCLAPDLKKSSNKKLYLRFREKRFYEMSSALK
jgi:hypothetical protein